jgi:lipopolysaccharide export system permease protein
MIFQRAAQREFAQTAIAVFVALFAIMLTTQLIRFLGQAAGGRIASEAVVALLGFSALNYLPVLLSLTLFVAILLSLARTYRDSEMAIWFSSGVPLTAWIRPVLIFAFPIVFAIAVLALFLSPWALTMRAEYQTRMDQRDDVARVSPGAFKESARGDRVFFVESVVGDDGTDQVKNIFISSVQHGRLGVMAASKGQTEVAPNGDKFLVLSQGRRYEGQAGSAEHRIMEFDRYAMRIETQESRGVEKTAKTLMTWDLLRDPTPANKGELLWRLGVPVSALLLSVLAIPLSFVNPRAGRTNNLIFALLAFMVYSNLLSVSQVWVSQGRLPFEVGIWAVHAVMAVVLVLYFAKRQLIFSVQRLWR